MKVIIVGAGIGGLTAALCCRHFGHDVVILEKHPKISEVGAGIQISPNAMKVFETLGLERIFEKHSFMPEHIETRVGRTGKQVFSIPLGDNAVHRWGSPYYHLHRADLIDALMAEVKRTDKISIQLGHNVSGYQQIEDKVHADLSNGSEVIGDALIGADGIHSKIRENMLGKDHPRFTGYMAWRAVVPIGKLGELAPAPTACAWMGQKRHCVTYRLRGGTLANFVGVIEKDDWQGESWTEQGHKDEALSDFASWHPTLLKLIENADELYKWALFDRAPLKQWVEGHVALMGDAAHPMLPFRAQGAAQAIEDSWVLARELSKPDIAHALKSYQSIRLERASKLQKASRNAAKIFHRKNRLEQSLFHGSLYALSKVWPEALHRTQDYTYGYDVTSKQHSGLRG